MLPYRLDHGDGLRADLRELRQHLQASRRMRQLPPIEAWIWSHSATARWQALLRGPCWRPTYQHLPVQRGQRAVHQPNLQKGQGSNAS